MRVHNEALFYDQVAVLVMFMGATFGTLLTGAIILIRRQLHVRVVARFESIR